MRNIIRDVTPPALLNFLSGLFYGWSGDYATWEEAGRRCTGYGDGQILEKVKLAMLKVKNGEAAFERDSVLFGEIRHSFPLLSALALVALRRGGRLNVLDYGGSLGSSYYQNRQFFTDIREFNWGVVEQPHFVQEGEKHFSDDHLKFFYDIPSCTAGSRIDLALFASSVQYLADPYAVLDRIASEKIEYLLLDRTPVSAGENDRITVQKVPGSIYRASYPCRIMSEQGLTRRLAAHYDLIYDFDSPDRINLRNCSVRGFFFRRKQAAGEPST